MSTFEFVFSLYGLLLGLSLAEVLGGFARAMRAHRTVPVGLQSPLLGLIVMLDLTAFWLLAWGIRDALAPTYRTLVIGLLISGLYYLAATMIFPQEGQAGTGLDDHYRRVKPKVLGALLACNLAAYIAAAALGAASLDLPKILHMLGFAALVGLVIVLRNRTANVVLLSVICAWYFAAML